MTKNTNKKEEQNQNEEVEQIDLEQEEMNEEEVVEEPVAEEPKEEQDDRQAKIDELNDRLLRTLAEYDNFRKRSAREKDQLYSMIVADTVSEFLPVLDSIERAISMIEDTESHEYEGLSMIREQFEKAFEKLGVEPIEAEGETFDPNLHNAVMHIEDDSVDDNTVVEEFAKGYKVHDRVIRYSMVKVAN